MIYAATCGEVDPTHRTHPQIAPEIPRGVGGGRRLQLVFTCARMRVALRYLTRVR